MKKFALLFAAISMFGAVSFAEDFPLKYQITFSGPAEPGNMVFLFEGQPAGAIYSQDGTVQQQLFEAAQKGETVCVDQHAEEGDVVVSSIYPAGQWPAACNN